MPGNIFGGTVSSLLFKICFCIRNKLIKGNFNAFFGSWCILSHGKLDKNTLLALAFNFKYNPTCTQGNFGHFVVSAQNCLSFSIFCK